METVVIEFITYILNNQHKSSHSNGQSQDIYKGRNSVSKQISEGDQDIITEHEANKLVVDR
jgi:hypothetical protein